jgi:hypothetical protein
MKESLSAAQETEAQQLAQTMAQAAQEELLQSTRPANHISEDECKGSQPAEQHGSAG